MPAESWTAGQQICVKVACRGRLAELEQYCDHHDEVYPLLAARAACEELALQHESMLHRHAGQDGTEASSCTAALPLSSALQVRYLASVHISCNADHHGGSTLRMKRPACAP